MFSNCLHVCVVVCASSGRPTMKQLADSSHHFVKIVVDAQLCCQRVSSKIDYSLLASIFSHFQFFLLFFPFCLYNRRLPLVFSLGRALIDKCCGVCFSFPWPSTTRHALIEHTHSLQSKTPNGLYLSRLRQGITIYIHQKEKWIEPEHSTFMPVTQNQKRSSFLYKKMLWFYISALSLIILLWW